MSPNRRCSTRAPPPRAPGCSLHFRSREGAARRQRDVLNPIGNGAGPSDPAPSMADSVQVMVTQGAQAAQRPHPLRLWAMTVNVNSWPAVSPLNVGVALPGTTWKTVAWLG